MPTLGLGVFLVFLVQEAPPPTPPAQTVSILLEARSSNLDLARVEVTASSEDGEQTIEPQRRDGIEVHFGLPTDRTWSVTCRGETFWCPSVHIAAGTGSNLSRRRLPVARRVRAWARLEVLRGELPKVVKLQGWELNPSATMPLELELEASVDNTNFVVELPDVPLDLRLAAPGFAPQYAWGLKPSSRPKTADGSRALGTWTLRPGSSLSGFVTDGVTGDPVAQAEIQLRLPPHHPGTPSQTARRMGRMAWKTQSNERGFFQIIGPPTGVYRLEVTPVDVGRLPRILPAIELAEQAETRLDTLEVRQAIPFRVLLEAPPGVTETSWQVRLSPVSADGHVTPKDAHGPGIEGYVRFRVAPGDYRLTVLSADLKLRAVSREITIQTDQTLSVQLDVLPVEGRVLLGETPLVAEVELNVDDGGSVKLESDAEGRFRGWTRRPKSGLAIQVKSIHPAFSRYLLRETFDIDDGVLRLDLELPDRRVTGTVHDEAGRPVRSARVTARPESSAEGVSSTTGVDGRFELVGLEDSSLVLRASARDIGDSERLRVEPWGDGVSPDILLVLRRGRILEGRVSTDLGEPLAAGRVQILTAGEHPKWVHDATNVSGQFEVHVPESATQAVIQVFSPRLNWSACLPLPPAGQPIEIRLPSAFGSSVRLQYDGKSVPFSQSILFNSDGGFFTLSQLLNFGDLRRVDGGYLASAIAPGAYATLTSPRWNVDLATLACARALPVEEWRQLTEGQELRFDLNR